MNMGMFMLFPVLLLGGGMGGSNELIDYMQSEYYWSSRNITPDAVTLSAMLVADPKAEDISALIKQLGHDDFNKREAASEAIGKKGPGVIPQLKEASKSTDAEVADRAGRLITQLSGGDADPAIHRLMIIRALGETKDKAALAALKTQLDSKEPFASEHAKRAIAKIEGVEFKSSGTTADTFEKDVWLLPKGVKFVAQMEMKSAGALNWTKALANVNIPIAPQVPKEEMFKQMQVGIGTALNMVGNIRIDGVTLGLSESPGNNSGFVIMLVRGQYSREKLKNLFKSQGVNITVEEGIDTVTPDQGGMKLMFVSDEMLVVIGGPPRQNALPIKELLAAIKTGKGTLSEDVEMTALINSADRKSGGWAAVQMSETYKSGAPWLRPFDSVLASRKSEKGKTTLKIEGTSKNADEVKQAVQQINAGLDEMRASFGQAGGFIPQPMIDFATTLKVEANGNKATLTGKLEGEFEDLVGSLMFPMMMLGGRGF